MTLAQIKLIIYACVALGLVGFGYWMGGAHGRVELANQRAKAEKTIAQMAKAESELQAKYRKAEQAKAQALADVAQTYEDRIHEIEADSRRRIAGLESGALRLRKQWAGCETNRLSETAADSAESARQDRLRRESAERIVRAVETVQAQRDGLREVAEADRK